MNNPSDDSKRENRLRFFPISIFSIVMGLAGLTIATHKIETTLALNAKASPVLLLVTGTIFVLFAFLYAWKVLAFPHDVVEEWRHPVRISFFPTITIALILLSIASYQMAPSLSAILWGVGTAGHIMLTLLVMTSWINHSRYEIVHSNPAWFIPVVGNILVPIVGIRHAPIDISWFFFSVGLLFWLVLLTIISYRLIFHSPLPGKMVPTLFIFIAPPSIGFISWNALNGGLDAPARILYAVALFFLILMIPQIRAFSRQIFALSWWAYSFPLAAFTIATLLMHDLSSLVFYRYLGITAYAGLVLLITGLSIRTILAGLRKEICRPE